MDWVKIKRLRSSSEEPEIIVKVDRITFNVVLVKLAELDKYKFVMIYSNDDNRKLGFKFFKERDDYDLFRLSRSGSRGFWCSSRDVLAKPWVKKAAQNSDLNRFMSKKEDGLWTISLIPCFENSVSKKDASLISSNLSGIYRYVNSTGEIVYIGKGNIKNRFNEKRREDWKFDFVEYSEILNEKESLEWERFHIDRFKNINCGELPKYNLINGHD